jgi:hypothetical protein
MPMPEENDQYSATTLSAIQAHQANPLLSMNNYNPFVIAINDRNEQLKLSQRKLALTAINKLFAF